MSQIRQGSTFMALQGYRDNFGGIANYSIVFHVDYISAVKKSLMIWQGYKPRNDMERKVRKYLLDSYLDTLQGYNPRAISAHTYVKVSDGKDLVRSVKWHDGGKSCHFWGFIVHKVELKKPIYPPTETSGLAITRRQLISKTPLKNFRQFKITTGRFASISVEHLTLTQKDLLKSYEHFT